LFTKLFEPGVGAFALVLSRLRLLVRVVQRHRSRQHALGEIGREAEDRPGARDVLAGKNSKFNFEFLPRPPFSGPFREGKNSIKIIGLFCLA